MQYDSDVADPQYVSPICLLYINYNSPISENIVVWYYASQNIFVIRKSGEVLKHQGLIGKKEWTNKNWASSIENYQIQ